MKTMTTVKWIAVLTLAAGLTVNAQGPGGGQGGGQGGGAGGQDGEHQRPTPEQLAKQLLEKHDANKDSELEKGELTQALEALRAHRPQGPGGGGQGGGGKGGGGQGGQHQAQAGGGGQGGKGGSGDGQRPPPPPADEVAAKMIEKFSSDKKGLTEAELAKALAEHRANRGKQGGGQHGGGAQGGPDGAK